MAEDIVFTFPFDSEALLFNEYLYYHYYSIHLKLLRNKETNYLEFKGSLFDVFSLGRVYKDWKSKRDSIKVDTEIKCFSTFTLSFNSDNEKMYFIGSLPTSKKILMAEVKEATILFKCDCYAAFEIGLIYKDHINSQLPKTDNVSRETLKPENIEKACKICIAVNDVVNLNAEQILKLYQTILENNL